MSDIEEPPTKVSKYEMSQTFTQPEEMEEGQEEWLSEGLLTDDDLNPENSVTDPDRTKSDLDSQGAAEDTLEESAQDAAQELKVEALEEVLQEESLQEVQDGQEQDQVQVGVESMENGAAESQETVDQPAQESIKSEDCKIEQTLSSMGARPDELEPPARRDSTGNDTDDLLRMLEDDDKTKKVKIAKPSHPKTSQNKKKVEMLLNQSTDDEDDDDYIFEGATVRQLKVAKNALVKSKFPPTKAEPESSDDESSSDEGATLRKMFSGGAGGAGAAGTGPGAAGTGRGAAGTGARRVARPVLRVGGASGGKHGGDKKAVTSTPPRQYSNANRRPVGRPPTRSVVKLVERPPDTNERKPKLEHEEIINEEEFLEEDDFDLREDFAAESDSELDKRAVTQRIMRPERMDEEMLSDQESHSDDGSLYDELPSSESDDMEEWFTLDVRGERAGDYLPLLGNKAYDLLIQEKVRVSERLASLRENLSALNATGKQQADRLRRATAALAEVDDMLKAA